MATSGLGFSAPFVTPRRTTIADVARVSGVSVSSVSKVLNLPETAYRMRSDTRSRVLQVAEELGYRPSFRAQSLARGRSHTIGVLYAPPMPTVVREASEGLIFGVEQVLAKRGYQLMFLPLGPDESRWAGMLREQRADGVLILNRVQPALGAALREAGLPAVLINGATDLPISRVGIDDVAAARAATQHLLELGHRDIWYYANVWAHEHVSIPRRQQGYREAMAAVGLGDRAHSSHKPFGEFVQEMKDAPRRPTAVVVYQHLEAIRLLQAMWRIGWRVPDEVSVVTFNDVYPVADVIPPLTTMSLPMREMGERAATWLLDQLDPSESDAQSEPAAPQIQVLQASLVVRESAAKVAF